jgi:acetyl esterase/lipase
MMSFRPWVRAALSFVNALLVLSAASTGVAAQGTAFVPEDTVISPERLQAAKPGTVFRVWPLQGGAPPGNKAYRVLYRSTDFNDRPVAVSGAIIYPDKPSTGPRRVVAWAHPTTGVVSRCAPTLISTLAGTIMGIDRLTDEDYVIVATDYVGLGTRDHHPYLVGESAARSVLDSVRAAQHFEDAHAGKRFAVWGHSQGGHAALFTGLAAASYAPDLELVGVAAAAPATDLVQLFIADRETESGRSLTSMVIYSWTNVFGLPLSDIVDMRAKSSFEALAHDCIETVSEFFKESTDEQALEKMFLKIDPVSYPPVTKLMQANSPGVLPSGMPVFIAQGTADDLVRPAITRAYISKLCGAGGRVKFYSMPGGGHMWAGRDSADAAVDWIGERFRGARVPNDCPS